MGWLLDPVNRENLLTPEFFADCDDDGGCGEEAECKCDAKENDGTQDHQEA